MMKRLAGHKPLLATVIGGSLICALVVTLAVTSDGYRMQRMDLGDASVWVTNQTKSLIGRANTQVLQLNSAVPSTTASVDVVQNSSTVLLLDEGNNTAGIIDPATASVDTSIPLPPKKPEVRLSATTVSIEAAGTGQLWLMPIAQLPDFSAESAPTLSLGVGAATSMASDGTLFAYSPDAGMVYRIDSATNNSVAMTSAVPASSAGASVAITSVGEHWAMLDSASATIHLASGDVDLSALLGTDPVLQSPSPSGSAVLVSSSTGLVSVPLNGGKPVRLTTESTSLGAPAAPVVVDDCVYAAWASGTTWRRCGSSPATSGLLASLPSNAALTFRVNESRVVLNDAQGGTSWAVQSDNAVIDNWDELVHKTSDEQKVEDNTADTPPEYEKAQVPPVALDDELGARPGRVTTLPVLLNDYDANGDVLVIGTLSALPETVGRLDLIDNHQQIQLTLPATAAGSISFEYTITDGRGGSATATVTVTVRTPDENSPPKQVRESVASVEAGDRTTTNVLGDWVDPDGDPFYLASATVRGPDSVTSTPSGTVVFSEASHSSGVRDVALVVADQAASGSGRLAVTVHGSGAVPLIAEPFEVFVTAGQQVRISPLGHVRGGSGPIRLANVPTPTDATIVADYDGGAFSFSSTSVGAHYLSYSATDGEQTVTGSVRVDVEAPPAANTTPITVQHTAFIRQQSTQDVDVLTGDIDPSGGVLLITGVSPIAPDSGIRVDVIEQRMLRVTLTSPLDSGPVTFNYTVTNGLASATGAVTVIEIPQLTLRQPPIANPDTISVRVGDAITIPVLKNDVRPDGEDLIIDPKLATPLPAGSGLLFVSGSVLRYLAPQKVGNFTAAYRVTSSDGQWASAQVKIQVRERDAASNNAPVPKTVTARVFAGQSVRIAIPLSGTDPDGDSVQLLGQDTNPAKGAVTSVGTDSIEYQAGDYSAGTDTFQYSVVDALGARAVGTVRVGIAAREDNVRNPIAVPDEVTVRPGKTVSVQVLANDSDPDGGSLTITGVRPTGSAGKAVIDGDVIKVTAGAAEGRYGFIYDIQNARGGANSNFLTLIVRSDAPLPRPVVSDTVLNLSDILDRDSVDVDVLANAFFAAGSAQDLGVSVLSAYSQSAQVLGNKKIRVEIGKKSQIIPFALANPEDPSITAYAFIWVPGLDDALPQLKRGARKLSVVSESTLRINLNDYVIAALGRSVMLTDSSTVQATHANGDNLVVDSNTLTFTSAARYFGPASISFQVTDGSSPDDPDGRIATLVLPIDVTPRQNQPPVFTGAEIDFEPGQAKTLDLVKLTSYPYAKDQSELAYQVLEPKPAGYTLHLNGTRLTVTAGAAAGKGTHASILVGVKDAVNTGHSGRIDIDIVPSTKPLAIPKPDTAVAVRGKDTTIDVLANDQATNPFPGIPLRVVAVRGIDSASLPDGISVAPSVDKSSLTVTVGAKAAPVDTNVQYEVADATGDSDRYTWGSVHISVQDKPEAITNLQVTDVGDKSVDLAWSPGAFNNSPITGFDVSVTRADTGAVFGTTTCTLATCTVPTPGNGPKNKVTLQVTARNAIGLSDPVEFPSAVWSNVLPAAPDALSAIPLDHGLHITWKKPPDAPGASPITQYVVTVAGLPSRSVEAGSISSYQIDISDPSLPNAQPATVTVTSQNDFYGEQTNWKSTLVKATPAGAPLVGTVSATAANDTGTAVKVSWKFDANGMPITDYYAVKYSGTLPSCSEAKTGASLGTATEASFSGLTPNAAYHFTVYAVNGQGCSPAAKVDYSAPRQKPSTPTAPVTSGPEPDESQVHHDYRINGFTFSPTPGASHATTTWRYALTGTNLDVQSDPLPWTGNDSPGALLVQGKHYGIPESVSLQVCDTYQDGQQLCSDWSAAKLLGTAVDLTVDGLHYDETTHLFTWTGAPSGPGYSAVEYECIGGTVFLPMGQSGSCDTGGAASDAAQLTVRVSANGATYTKTYGGTP